MSDVADAADVDVPENPEADGAEGGAEDGAQPLGKKKLIIFAAAGVLALAVIGGAAAYFLGFFSSETGDGEAVATQVYFHQLPEMTVNLSSSGGRAQYLKVRVSLEMSDKAVLKALDPAEPIIMDAFQTHLRELRPSDLEGSMGIYRMKEELLRRVNLAIHPLKVDRVLFNEMLIQ
ncbi:MAG: flagellar basal body-associated FliL family protein [Rhodobiaceae bacterium]|nr:flagellar basal body-associated FliL family protein [Rhodobiaceae bacterium]